MKLSMLLPISLYAIPDGVVPALSAEAVNVLPIAVNAITAADNADTPDMFDAYSSPTIDNMINRQQNARRTALVNQMRAAINGTPAPQTPQQSQIPQQPIQTPPQPYQANPYSASPYPNNSYIQPAPTEPVQPSGTQFFNPDPTYDPLTSDAVIRPGQTFTKTALSEQAKANRAAENQTFTKTALSEQAKANRAAENRAKLNALANNDDISIETIAKEAKRINEENNDKEIYVSLH